MSDTESQNLQARVTGYIAGRLPNLIKVDHFEVTEIGHLVVRTASGRQVVVHVEVNDP